jgi:hypothetical protein
MMYSLLDQLVDLPGEVLVGGAGRPPFTLQVYQVAVDLAQLKIYQRLGISYEQPTRTESK